MRADRVRLLRMIRGVLFDTGGVLTGPAGGRWNPRFDFEEVLLLHHPDAPQEQFARAFEVGQRYLDQSEPKTKPRDDYHRAILDDLGIAPSDALLAELNVLLPVPVLEAFPEVESVLTELQRRGIRMAVVTDNWGTAESNRRLHDQVGIGSFFETFAVSEEIGCGKPDPRIFDAGRTAISLQPQECLFVDDVPELVKAAIELGYVGVAICRGSGPRPQDVPSVRDLTEILALI
jgi:putative hydrolase of the HAD superfamily